MFENWRIGTLSAGRKGRCSVYCPHRKTVKINGGVLCTTNRWCRQHSDGVRTIVHVDHRRHKQMPLCNVSVDLALITDDDAKNAQNATYFFLIMDSGGKKAVPRATFASPIVCFHLVPFRSYLALKLTILEHST